MASITSIILYVEYPHFRWIQKYMQIKLGMHYYGENIFWYSNKVLQKT